MAEKPLTAADKDQQQGLVSGAIFPHTLAYKILRQAFQLCGVLGRRGLSEADSALLQLQKSIREFLKVRTSYDVLPLSYRLIILNTDLLVKKSLNILLQNGTLPQTANPSNYVTIAKEQIQELSLLHSGIRTPRPLQAFSQPPTT